jgi:hypothetical protein
VVKEFLAFTEVGAIFNSATFVSLIGPLTLGSGLMQLHSAFNRAPVLKLVASTATPLKIESDTATQVIIPRRLSIR